MQSGAFCLWQIADASAASAFKTRQLTAEQFDKLKKKTEAKGKNKTMEFLVCCVLCLFNS